MRAALVLVLAWSSVADANPSEEASTRVVGELSLDVGAFYSPQQLDTREWRQLYGLGASIGGEVRPRLAMLAHATFLSNNRPETDAAIFVGSIACYRSGAVRFGGGAGFSIKVTNLGDESGRKHDLLGFAGVLKAEVVAAPVAFGVEINVDLLPTVNAHFPSAPWPMFMFTVGIGRY